MLYDTIQKFSDTDDKIAKSVGIQLLDIRECILDLMELYGKDFDDVEDVSVFVGFEWKKVDLFEFLEAARVGSAMTNQIIHFVVNFKDGDFIRSEAGEYPDEYIHIQYIRLPEKPTRKVHLKSLISSSVIDKNEKIQELPADQQEALEKLIGKETDIVS